MLTQTIAEATGKLTVLTLLNALIEVPVFDGWIILKSGFHDVSK
jgi:hypothetical protein